MPVAELKKAVLYYHKSIQDEVLLTLQRSGACEIIPSSEAALSGGGEAAPSESVSSEAAVSTVAANANKTSAAAKVTKCDSVLVDLRFLLRFLEPYYNDPVSSMARAFGEKPGSSLNELAELARSCDVSEKLEAVRDFERKLSSIRIEMSQLDNTKAILDNLSGFPHGVNIFGSKGRLRAIAGSLPFTQSEAWKESLLGQVGKDCEIYLSPPKIKERDIWGVVMYASERESEVLEICSKSGFTESELDFGGDGKRSVSEQLALIKARYDKLCAEEKSVHEEVTKYAGENVDALRKLTDYQNVLKERSQAFADGEFTDSAVVTSFWVPASELPSIEKKLISLGVCELTASDPAKDEDVPSLMMNNSWNLPYEVLTKLYSSPKYGSMDPTPKLAPFFFVFFGMCFGDAGYAMIMAGLLFFVFKKYKKIPANLREFMRLFMMVSIPTFVYGAITGSFFGDLFAVVPFLRPLNVIREAVTLVDPMKDPMLVLGISLAFGVVHLFYGMILAFKICWEEENYVDAIFDKAAWLVFLTGLLLIGGAAASGSGILMRLAQLIALVGALAVMFYAGLEKKGIISKIIAGLLSLYGATSWLGDVLSYSRLLALGLASAAVATIINMLGGLAAGIPYVGWLIAAFIVVGGHIFNVAINVLGAFVHSLRLQYVEFFSKFYSGGGREYNPLSCNAKYVDIVEK